MPAKIKLTPVKIVPYHTGDAEAVGAFKAKLDRTVAAVHDAYKAIGLKHEYLDNQSGFGPKKWIRIKDGIHQVSVRFEEQRCRSRYERSNRIIIFVGDRYRGRNLRYIESQYGFDFEKIAKESAEYLANEKKIFQDRLAEQAAKEAFDERVQAVVKTVFGKDAQPYSIDVGSGISLHVQPQYRHVDIDINLDGKQIAQLEPLLRAIKALPERRDPDELGRNK